MEDMSTGTSDAGRGRKSLDVAHCTILIAIDSVEFWVSLSTFLVETGEASFLSLAAIARVTTRQGLVACSSHQLLTLLFLTDVCESLGGCKVDISLCDDIVTVAAFPE